MGISQKLVIMVGVTLAIISLLSPFFSVIYIGPSGTSISMHTLFWGILANFPGTQTISINEFWTIFGNFPFVAFRLGVAIQFIRYYDMKVTRFRLAITGLAGEIPPLLLIIGMPPALYLSQIVSPLPFHLLLCAIIVFLKPVRHNDDVFHEYESLYSYDDTSDTS